MAIGNPDFNVGQMNQIASLLMRQQESDDREDPVGGALNQIMQLARLGSLGGPGGGETLPMGEDFSPIMEVFMEGVGSVGF